MSQEEQPSNHHSNQANGNTDCDIVQAQHLKQQHFYRRANQNHKNKSQRKRDRENARAQQHQNPDPNPKPQSTSSIMMPAINTDSYQELYQSELYDFLESIDLVHLQSHLIQNGWTCVDDLKLIDPYDSNLRSIPEGFRTRILHAVQSMDTYTTNHGSQQNDDPIDDTNHGSASQQNDDTKEEAVDVFLTVKELKVLLRNRGSENVNFKKKELMQMYKSKQDVAVDFSSLRCTDLQIECKASGMECKGLKKQGLIDKLS
eukprot:802594_1